MFGGVCYLVLAILIWNVGRGPSTMGHGGGSACGRGEYGPPDLDVPRFSLMASGGWIGSYSSVASIPAYFLLGQPYLARICHSRTGKQGGHGQENIGRTR